MDEENYKPEDAAPPRQSGDASGNAGLPPDYHYGPEPPNAIEQNSDAKTWGMLCHLSSLAGYVIPFGNVIGPLICWLVKKDEYGFADDQGRESLNFQITISIIILALSAVGFATLCIYIGFAILALVPVVGIFDLVMAIIAAIKANNGEYYRYPVTIRMIN